MPARDPQTGDILVSQLDRSVREKLYQAVSARADELLVELKMSWPVRKAIEAFYVNPQLKNVSRFEWLNVCRRFKVL